MHRAHLGSEIVVMVETKENHTPWEFSQALDKLTCDLLSKTWARRELLRGTIFSRRQGPHGGRSSGELSSRRTDL